MRIKRAKLFIKAYPYGRRAYFILLFRSLLSHPGLLLFLHYDGDSSDKLNELRYLAINHQVTVHLLLRKWVSSIFSHSNPTMAALRCRLVVLSSIQEESLLALSQKAQFTALLEYFPFVALGHRGLLSQEPFFLLLSQPKGLFLLRLLLYLPHLLMPIPVLSLLLLKRVFYLIKNSKLT